MGRGISWGALDSSLGALGGRVGSRLTGKPPGAIEIEGDYQGKCHLRRLIHTEYHLSIERMSLSDPARPASAEGYWREAAHPSPGSRRARLSCDRGN